MAADTQGPLAVLRFDASPRLGEAVLLLARRLFPDVSLFAEVLPANAASRALFRGAGYRPPGDGLFVNRPHTNEVSHAS